MEKSSFIFSNSPLWITVCLLAGILYAVLLYWKESFFSNSVRYILAILRFLAVSLISFLLLSPVIRTVRNQAEKPIIAFALDNSLSIALTEDSSKRKKWLNEFATIQKQLQQEGFETALHTFEENSEWGKVQFNVQSTNLGKLLENIATTYENRNLDKVVLISDGIYNQGISPEFMHFKFPIYTVGVGDTTSHKDIAVQAVFFNKIAYLGNKFPIVAEIKNNNFEERNVTVWLLHNGNKIASQNIRLRKDNISEVDFLVQATQKGIQRYTVAVEFLEGEHNHNNNQRDAFVEIIDSKEKILLLASVPHPDIKALRSIIEKNENYSFEIAIAGIQQPKENLYDLIIAYQVPDYSGVFNTFLDNFQKKGIPVLYILGANSDLNKFSESNSVLTIKGRSWDLDEIFSYFNTTFSKFNFDSEKLRLLTRMPPLQAPYGEYSLKTGTEVLLYQMIGRLQTQKPLLAIQMNKQNKAAVLTGEGLWQWRMAEYELTNRNEIIDEIFLKVIQFLSSKEDKRKLRIYTTQNEYLNYETVTFEAEAYNELYEKISDVKVNLSLQDEKGKSYNYTFTITGGITKFEINNLPKGIYKYTATADVMGKIEKVSGEFAIKELQLESLSTTADFDLLRKIAKNSQGKFFEINQLAELQQEVLLHKKSDILHSSEELLEIIHLKWLFFLILALLAIEWFVRKFLGSY